MDTQQADTARKCLVAAHDGTMDFPTIVRALSTAGFEGYSVDFRRCTAIYYLPNGDNIELPAHEQTADVAVEFCPDVIARAVREAQANTAGYRYVDFCEQVKRAGCAGYMVSFLGKRVLYWGRDARTHVEHFPQ